MAFRMKRPLKMKGPLKRSNLIQIGSKRNTEINSDTSGVFYNGKLGPMQMLSPSALKQEETKEEALDALRKKHSEKESPFQPTDNSKQEGERNIGVLPSEMEGTWVYDGTRISERIADYEDRISFIEEDVWNQQEGDPNAGVDMSQATDQQKKDHATLTGLLEELYAEQEEGGK